MNNIKELYLKVEGILSSAKFAVAIITIFAIALVIGTFQESYHGTDFANRLIYKSWWFLGLQGLMFISIFMATLVRLPLKKRLYGFYVIHAGLLTLFIGSFFTYITGIDGSIQILPNTPSKTVQLGEDIVKVAFIEDNKEYSVKLPYNAFETNLDIDIRDIKILKFLPSAELKTSWIDDPMMSTRQHSTHFQIFNEMVSEEVILSLHQSSDFKSMEKMGPLTLHYMPFILKDCFLKEGKSGFIFWNLKTEQCFTPEEKNLPVEKTPKDSVFVVLKDENNKMLKFFPDFSPVPINDDLSKDMDSPYRVLAKNLFSDKPNLFIFGDEIVYYQKRNSKWVSKNFREKKLIKLPWMNFQLRLIKHSNSSYPMQIPVFTKPTQESGQVVSGDKKAIQIQLGKNIYWVRSDSPLALSNGKSEIRIQITTTQIELPYQITLERFQMNTDPGTKNPASYESFVQLLDSRNNEGVSKHHVFMNNPLKYDDFTFYQASYFPIGPEQYASVLSVNYDPGRFLKYLGSLLIVLGSIWHFIINRRKKKA